MFFLLFLLLKKDQKSPDLYFKMTIKSYPHLMLFYYNYSIKNEVMQILFNAFFGENSQDNKDATDNTNQ